MGKRKAGTRAHIRTPISTPTLAVSNSSSEFLLIPESPTSSLTFLHFLFPLISHFPLSSSHFVFSSFYFYFFLRKISPELTTASPPLFAEEAWPCASIMPIFLYFLCGTPATDRRCHVREPANPGPPRSGTSELNRCATRLAPQVPIFKIKFFKNECMQK